MDAASRTFSLPELLQHILLHLPAADLLLAQRVNASWRDIVSESKLIQQSLFLAPSGNISLDRYTNSGWMVQKWQAWDHEKELFIHPLIKSLVSTQDGGEGIRHDGFVSHSAGPEIVKAPHEKDAKWRRMSLCFPPVHNMNVYCTLRGNGTCPKSHIENKSASGITAGNMVDALRDHWAIFHNRSTTLEGEQSIDGTYTWPRRWHFSGDFGMQTMSTQSTGYEVLAKIAEIASSDRS